MDRDKLADKVEKDLNKLSSTIGKFLLYIMDLEKQIESLTQENKVFKSRVYDLKSDIKRKRAIIEHFQRQKKDLLSEIQGLKK